MSIRLHPKFGLNPALSTCFWCGGEKNEVLLLGAAYKNKAPRHLVASYEPCEKCLEVMCQGIVFVEGTACSDERPPLAPGGDIAPTGRWLVIKEEAVHRIGIQPPELLDQILTAGRTLVEPQVFSHLMQMDGLQTTALSGETDARVRAH